MKYIRTKDGIYEKNEVFVVKENNTELILLDIDKKFVERTRGKSWNYGTNEIIKQADTIEELCDEFVCVLKNGEHNRVLLSMAKEYAKGKMEIYGAIWTKGEHDEPILKSVAKLNDKGELELL